jgi:hypothetical protein
VWESKADGLLRKTVEKKRTISVFVCVFSIFRTSGRMEVGEFVQGAHFREIRVGVLHMVILRCPRMSVSHGQFIPSQLEFWGGIWVVNNLTDYLVEAWTRTRTGTDV